MNLENIEGQCSLCSAFLLVNNHKSSSCSVHPQNVKMNIISKSNAGGQTKVSSFGYAAPSHYTFKTESYSLFSQHSIDKFESNVFESGGYKWKLVFYPNEYNRSRKKNHISLYLEVVETDDLTDGWEINAAVGLFLYDQIRETYMKFEDGGRFQRFHAFTTKWGYSQLISVASFNDPSNGYLVDDTCIFGAEVFVCKSTGEGDCFSMIEDATSYKHTWKIKNFSVIKMKEHVYCELFNAGNWKCKIELFPKDSGKENNKFMSLCLYFEDSSKVYAKYKLQMKDQFSGDDEEVEGTEWFDEYGWGGDEFIALKRFNDPTNGFLVNDSVIIEAEVSVLGSSVSICTGSASTA